MSESIRIEQKETRSQLLATNSEFRKLYRKHQELEARLDELDRKGFLTPEEEFTRKQIQKEKLFDKDRMELLIRRHAPRGASAA